MSSDSGSEVSTSGNISRIQPMVGLESPVEERRVSTEEMGAARREGLLGELFEGPR